MITQTGEYALRAMVFLAGKPAEQQTTAQEIARSTGVPIGYLQKILRELGRHALVRAQRGVTGGFSLAKPAVSISVLDVLDASNSGVARITHCPLGLPEHENLCPLHRLLDSRLEEIERVFAETSLIDLIEAGDGTQGLCDPAG